MAETEVDIIPKGIHHTEHETGGIDEIGVAGLLGLLAADQHVIDAEVLAVAAALLHAARHQAGGADVMTVNGLAGLLTENQHVIDAEVLAITSKLTVAETEVLDVTTPNPSIWTDLDVSGTVGSNPALLLIKIDADTDVGAVAVRKNGDTDEFLDPAIDAKGAALAKHGAGTHLVLMVATDNNGIIEWYSTGKDDAHFTIDIIAYIK